MYSYTVIGHLPCHRHTLRRSFIIIPSPVISSLPTQLRSASALEPAVLARNLLNPAQRDATFLLGLRRTTREKLAHGSEGDIERAGRGVVDCREEDGATLVGQLVALSAL